MMTGLLAGCAYAPAGTLIGALDAADFSQPTATSAPTPQVSPNLSASPAQDEPDGSIPQGADTVASVDAVSGDPIAAETESASGALMSFDEAEQTRLQLQEIARSQGNRRGSRPQTSLERLKTLGAEHDDRARREIEGIDGSGAVSQ